MCLACAPFRSFGTRHNGFSLLFQLRLRQAVILDLFLNSNSAHAYKREPPLATPQTAPEVPRQTHTPQAGRGSTTVTELPLLTAQCGGRPRKACGVSLSPNQPSVKLGSLNTFQVPSIHHSQIRTAYPGDLEKQIPLCRCQGSPDNTELQAELEMTPRPGP